MDSDVQLSKGKVLHPSEKDLKEIGIAVCRAMKVRIKRKRKGPIHEDYRIVVVVK